MTNETNTQTSETTAAGSTTTQGKKTKPTTDENRWVARFEELLQVKNLDELRDELTKLAGEIQEEIQEFDINAHLSPEAKTRLRHLEGQYTKVVRTIGKAQKQFDREFNRSLRILKRTRTDAEKQFGQIKTRLTKHTADLAKASTGFKKKLKAKAKKVKKTATKKTAKRTTVRKTTKAKRA